MNLESSLRLPTAGVAEHLSGRLLRHASGRGAAKNPGGSRGTPGTRPLVPRHPLRRQPLSFQKIVASVCCLGKYPLPSPRSHERSLLPPGHGVCFFPLLLVEPLCNAGHSPDTLGFEKEKGVVVVFCFVFKLLLLTFCFKLRWIGAGFAHGTTLCRGDRAGCRRIALPEGEAEVVGLGSFPSWIAISPPLPDSRAASSPLLLVPRSHTSAAW